MKMRHGKRWVLIAMAVFTVLGAAFHFRVVIFRAVYFSLDAETRSFMLESMADHDKTTPYILAAYLQDHEVIPYFAEEETVNAREAGPLGFSALHVASVLNHGEMAEALLDRGADIEIRSRQHHETPLNVAVLHESDKVVLVLLARGASLQAKAYGGNTPMHIAVSENYVDIAKILERHAPDWHIENDAGQSVLELACYKQRFALVESVGRQLSCDNGQVR